MKPTAKQRICLFSGENMALLNGSLNDGAAHVL
jgi:hypothetical protein